MMASFGGVAWSRFRTVPTAAKGPRSDRGRIAAVAYIVQSAPALLSKLQTTLLAALRFDAVSGAADVS
jgi:hypothetical protein